MTDWAPKSLSVSSEVSQTQITKTWETNNTFHEALTTVLSSQDKNGYQYPRELEFLREILSSETVREQIKEFIKQQARLFIDIFKERKEKSLRNPNKEIKPVKYLTGVLSLILPFDSGIHARLSPNYRGRDVSMVILSLYPELSDFYPKSMDPYTHLKVLDESKSFDLEKKDDGWFIDSPRNTSKEKYNPEFMEFEVRTRKMITPEDIAFLESQLVSQQK